MELITQADYARRKGRSRQYINRLVNEGVLPTEGERKLINPTAADAALPPSRKAATAEPTDADTPDTAAIPATSEPSSGPTVGQHLTRAKAHSETLRAKTAELEYRRRVGELLPRDLVSDAMAEAGGKVARAIDRLVRDADEIAEAAVRGGAKEVRALLRGKIRNIRAEVAEFISLPETEKADQ